MRRIAPTLGGMIGMTQGTLLYAVFLDSLFSLTNLISPVLGLLLAGFGTLAGVLFTRFLLDAAHKRYNPGALPIQKGSIFYQWLGGAGGGIVLLAVAVLCVPLPKDLPQVLRLLRLFGFSGVLWLLIIVLTVRSVKPQPMRS